ncbi:ADP-ribosylglycohydrolase family protein [Leifsonia sp. NPDC056665]|uniref:ADP-ribosylglycohydrolase family protein n=1 Tax=Leifsonia sp. NPDC056665 TaxID=3345901 RepID=UPI0036C58CD5
MIATAPSDRFMNVVLASRVGDAMGTPTEGLTVDEIDARFGWVETFEGDGTDDSLMATILSETLVAGDGYGTSDAWAERIVHSKNLIYEKRDKFFISIMHLLEKLEVGYRPSEVAVGNMASSSSAMCIWPVGLVNAAQPALAARQAYELAQLIHTNEVDYCTDAAAAVAAAVAATFLPGATIETSIEEALRTLRPISGDLLRKTVARACQLAEDSQSYPEFRDRYQDLFSRRIMCDSLETVPAAFALSLLSGGDARIAVEYGANFGHDTDTIASIAGALCGALTSEMPVRWFDMLGPAAVADARTVAERLLAVARTRHNVMAEELTVAAIAMGTPL